MSKPIVFSGARAVIKFNDAPLVFAMDVNYSIHTNVEVIRTIDNSIPDELAPTIVEASLNCKSFRIPGLSPAKLNLQPNVLATLKQQYATIEVCDRLTDSTVLYLPRAMMTNRTGGLSARSLAIETWSFIGIGFWDEQLPTIPKSQNAAQNGAAALTSTGEAAQTGPFQPPVASIKTG